MHVVADVFMVDVCVVSRRDRWWVLVDSVRDENQRLGRDDG
jgi:hypothetical protein